MFWFIGKFKKRKCKRLALSLSGGFTLLELIVVIAIFLIVTGVVLVDIPNFRNRSSIELVTSEIATYVRGAQVYSSAQKVASGSTLDWYEIRFIKGLNTFSLFNSNSPTEAEETYKIDGFTIQTFSCYGYNPDLSDLSIRYKVFDTQSFGTDLTATFFSGGSSIEASYCDIKVVSKRSPDNKCVRIYSNGQITVTSCS